MNGVAAIIIASSARSALVREQCIPAAQKASPTELVVVADYEDSVSGVRWLCVPPLLRNTCDALIKRDIGTLATTSDWLCYVCDDHALRAVPKGLPDPRLIGVPARFCTLETHEQVLLPMGLAGENAPYCAGHAGLFHRALVRRRPWSTMPRDRLWDVLSSRLYMEDGAHIVGPLGGFTVEDLEPVRAPWR